MYILWTGLCFHPPFELVTLILLADFCLLLISVVKYCSHHRIILQVSSPSNCLNKNHCEVNLRRQF